MDIKDLVELAKIADQEGNYRIADKLTSRIAARLPAIGESLAEFFAGVGIKPKGFRGGDIPEGMTEFHGRLIPKEHLPGAMQALDYDVAKKAGPGAAQAGVGNPLTQTAPSGAPAAQAGVSAGGGLHQTVGGVTPGASPALTQTTTGGAPVAQSALQLHLNMPEAKPGRAGRNGKDGAQGIQGVQGLQGAQGIQGQAGPQGKAGAWWPGVVAGLASGALTAAGVGAYLKGQGASNSDIAAIQAHLSRTPQFQMMTRRTDSGDLTGAKAIRAQNFVDSNATNPRLKNQRDWYNLALQVSGGDKNFANNVISLVKATPQMPSASGGGPNI